MKKALIVTVVLLMTVCISNAQPGDPGPPCGTPPCGGPGAVPISGLEYLLFGGVALGSGFYFSKKGSKNSEIAEKE